MFIQVFTTIVHASFSSNHSSTHCNENSSLAKRKPIDYEVCRFLQKMNKSMSEIAPHIDKHRNVVLNHTPIRSEDYPKYDTSKILMIQEINKDFLSKLTELENECLCLVKKHEKDDGMFLTNDCLTTRLEKIKKTSGILYEIDSKCKAMLAVYNRLGIYTRRTFAQTHFSDN